MDEGDRESALVHEEPAVASLFVLIAVAPLALAQLSAGTLKTTRVFVAGVVFASCRILYSLARFVKMHTVHTHVVV